MFELPSQPLACPLSACCTTSQQTPLRDGLRRMAESAWGVGIQSGRPFSDVEIGRDLPPSWRVLLRSLAAAVTPPLRCRSLMIGSREIDSLGQFGPSPSVVP